jgi:hypothetical protein
MLKFSNINLMNFLIYISFLFLLMLFLYPFMLFVCFVISGNVLLWCIFLLILFYFLLEKKIFKVLIKSNIDQVPFYNFKEYQEKRNNTVNKLVIFYPEKLEDKDKEEILYFIKLLDIYYFNSKQYLLNFIKQIIFINAFIFFISITFLTFLKKNYYKYELELLWIGLVSIIYIKYFFYWIKLFHYKNIDKQYQALIKKPSFKNNVTFYVVPLKSAFSLSEFFKLSLSKREDNFEKYINYMVQLLLPISYIAFLTFFAGFK